MLHYSNLCIISKHIKRISDINIVTENDIYFSINQPTILADNASIQLVLSYVDERSDQSCCCIKKNIDSDINKYLNSINKNFPGEMLGYSIDVESYGKILIVIVVIKFQLYKQTI